MKSLKRKTQRFISLFDLFEALFLELKVFFIKCHKFKSNVLLSVVTFT